jgi:NADH-quinone oxidoreductase subunit D
MTMPELRSETMTVNMGPQHPSTHGVFQLVLEIDGEVIVSARATIGYLHTGIEKTSENKKWQQVVPLIERTDYLGAQSNSLAYALSVEKLLGVEMPDRVKWIRVLLVELQRLNSHLVWLGTHAMDLGAVSVMLYCFRERELILNVNELIAGFRMFPSYIRIGGLREDLPRGFHDTVRELLQRMPGKLAEYEDLLTGNPIFVRRTQGVGTFNLDQCLQYGLVGPMARAAGSTYDVRKAYPYSGYETFEFDIPTFTGGDVFDRYRTRIREMHESIRISLQALDRITPAGAFQIDDPKIVPPPKDKVYTEMEALIQHFLIHSQGFTVPAGEAFVPVEGPRGEHGVYIASDGTNRPVRVHLRPPSLLACQAMEPMCVGALIADVVAIIGSTDIVLGDVDR